MRPAIWSARKGGRCCDATTPCDALAYPKHSQDLYVLRRAVGLYERLVRRFTAQTTDYQTLLSTFAEGLYTELDFRNEALNNERMAQLLDASAFDASRVVIPRPLMDMTSR